MYPGYIKAALVVSLAAVSTTLLAGAASPQSAGEVSGQPVNIEDFPFVAFMTSTRGDVIVVTLVNEWFILTTGTVADFISMYNHTEEISVRVGTTNPERGQIYKLEKAIIHEKYNFSCDFFDYNIGLFKLATPLTFGSTVAAATFAPKRLVIKTGTEVNIIRAVDKTDDYEMKRYTGSYLNSRDCQRSYTGWPWTNITQQEFCVIEGRKISSWMFYDGSPVVLNGTILGFSLMKRDIDHEPGLYLKISDYIEWIERQITQNI